MFTMFATACVTSIESSQDVQELSVTERIQLAALLLNSAAAEVQEQKPALAKRIWESAEKTGRMERAVSIKLHKSK